MQCLLPLKVTAPASRLGKMLGGCSPL